MSQPGSEPTAVSRPVLFSTNVTFFYSFLPKTSALSSVLHDLPSIPPHELYILRRTLMDEITAATRYCAVYGSPIQHSASPAMQNAGLGKLALNWRYLAFDVHPDKLPEAIQGAKAMKFIGLNLTVPHKLLALPLMDQLDESAKTWGAVNTVQFLARSTPHSDWQPIATLSPNLIHEISAKGFNTDADAIIRSIREDLALELRGATVLLLGAGGAGRVAALKLAAESVATLFLVNRTTEKCLEIQTEIARRFPGVRVEIGYPAQNDKIHLILNATSLGLKETDPLPFDLNQFQLTQAAYAYDMIYRPAETPFLKLAKAAGCGFANGIGMLLYQGAKALEIWTGQSAPIDAMRTALMRNVYGH